MRVYKILIVSLLAAIIVLAGSLFYIRYLIFSPNGGNTEVQEFTVEEGKGASAIAQDLRTKGLIKSVFAFKFYAIWQRNFNKIQAGTFDLNGNMSIADILKILTGEENSNSKFTIIEGERLLEIAQNLQKDNLVDYKAFMNSVSSESPLKKEYSFLQDIPEQASLEGFLFPDSYGFTKEQSSPEIVKQMLDNFQEKIKPYESNVRKSKYSLFEIITMASIVEREAAKDEDRAKIASVYYNRLKQGMRLQADPTVQYAKGSWDPISVSDYTDVKSPYNTYLHDGFPPGPICNPGILSIEAALKPDKTDYLFFFHLKDGTTIFSKTLEEHNSQKQHYSLTNQR